MGFILLLLSALKVRPAEPGVSSQVAGGICKPVRDGFTFVTFSTHHIVSFAHDLMLKIVYL